MNQRLDELCKEMNKRNSGELAGIVSDETIGEEAAVKSQKILSEDTAHYILIKRSEQQQQEQEQKQSKDFSEEGGFFREDQDCEIVSWTNPRPKPATPTKIPSFDIPDLCSSDSEIVSPFLDVPEIDHSPTSSKAKRDTFSFSPVKEKGTAERDFSRLNENVVEKDELQKPKSQSYDMLVSGNEDEKSVRKDSK